MRGSIDKSIEFWEDRVSKDLRFFQAVGGQRALKDLLYSEKMLDKAKKRKES